MEEIDKSKLDTAITYIQRIADGMDPVSNHTAEENSVLNNPNVIRCMFFVRDVLQEVRDNNYTIGKKAKKSKTLKEPFPLDVLQFFKYYNDCGISRLVTRINEMVDVDVYEKLSYRPIVAWLKTNNYLTDEIDPVKGSKATRPTEKGREIGIYTEEKINSVGAAYIAVNYNEEAQRFVIDHLTEIFR